MNKIILSGLSLFILIGCVPLIIGAGIVTGYALSGDSASGNVKSEYRVLWDVCLDQLESAKAEILLSNESKGVLKALVSENRMVISIDTIDFENQRLKVSARKYLMPKLQFAQKFFFKVIQDLQ